ncbi:MAG: response regulator [Alphaproteobacteria bacterium]|nr:response regulator [Alphaproteobacteria bacterium]
MSYRSEHEPGEAPDGDLRARAEEVLKRVEQRRPVSVIELEAALHELSVHRVELELQNSELQHTYARLQEANRTFEALFELAPVGYVLVDRYGRARQANAAFARTIGISKAAINGASLLNFVGHQGLRAVLLHLSRAQRNEHTSATDVCLRSLDGERWFRMTSAPWSLDDEDAALCTFTDIDELLRTQRALHDARSNLERRVHERTAECQQTNADLTAEVKRREQVERQLRVAIDDAEHSARVRALFTANVSHEIRTPLNGVLGLSRLLHQTALSEEQRDLVSMLMASGQQLLSLVNGMLDFSKIESGNLDLAVSPFAPRPMIEQLTKTFEVTAKGRGVSLVLDFDPDAPEQIVGDRAKVGQVVSNLVSNALKFTTEGEVCVRVLPHDAQFVRFEVQDTGIGIPADEQGDLFDPYTQVLSQRAERHGTGLGLAICRQLVTLMGGQIGLRSELGVGSLFWFTIPLRTDSFDLLVVEPSPAAPATLPMLKQQVLIVDDNAINQRVAEAILRELGCEAAVAGDGETALKLMAQRPFDAVLMDCRMPGMDGFEVTRQVRAAPGPNQNTWIIAATALSRLDDQHRCMDAGMNAFVRKPLIPEELAHALLGEEPEEEAETSGVRTARSLFPLLDMASLRSSEALFGASDLASLLSDLKRRIVLETAQLRAGVQAGDLNKATEIAHALRGSAGSLGVVRLAQLLERLEDRPPSTQEGWLHALSHMDDLAAQTVGALSEICTELRARAS